MPRVYILRCSDESLYIGHTPDVARRVATHNEGKGGRYTALRRPVRIVHCEQCALLQQAIEGERQLKRWLRAKKEALIAAHVALLSHL